MFKVVVHPRLEKLVSQKYLTAEGQLDLEDAIRAAGWDPKDPGVGGAVIAEDGREIVSPSKFEEPADIEAGQDMFEVMERRIMQRLRVGLFTGEDVVDETADEALDFAVRDDIEYVSGYEVEMAEEFPQMPTPAPRPGAEEAEVKVTAVAPAPDVEPVEPAKPAKSSKKASPAVPEERDLVSDR